AAERPTAVAMSSPAPESAAPAQAPPHATPAGPVAVDAAKAAATELAKSVAPTDAVRKQRAAPARESRVAEMAAMRRSETIDDTVQQRAAEDASRGAAARQDRAAAEPAAPPAVAAAPAATDTAAERLALARGRVEAPTAPATPAAPTAPAPATPGAESAAEPAPRAAARSEAGLRAALPRAGQAMLSETATAASPASTLLRRAQAELAAGGTDWTWIPPGGVAMVPFDDAARGWLSRVVQASRGRWVDAGERGESLDALEVRWWRDGWPHATLRIEAEGLRWIEAGRVRYAPLDAATLRQLRSL
ncbi:MAG TPA: hypothetical protein VI032_09360, partial [Burkholderiaceae bacterium]